MCVGLEESLCRERERLAQLHGDFNHNLSLLSARDEELSRYETSFREIKQVVVALVAENSELKVHLINLTLGQWVVTGCHSIMHVTITSLLM